MNTPLRWSRPLAVSILLVTLSGCVVGPKVGALVPAQTGQGIDIVVVPVETLDGPKHGRIDGELLAVHDDALILRAGLIARVSYPSIASAKVEGMKRLNFGDGEPPTEEQREELRLLSRYPQGVSDDLLRLLLDAYDQDELHTIP